MVLPDKGVVLVTGDNGSGKSTVIECVPLTLWGKTLRKADLWNGTGGSAAIVADGTSYRRKAKGRSRLTFDNAPKFESTKEAQIVIDNHFGPFEHWRRACVLSSQDAASLTTSTDAERKRLLEALTGADKLEAGYRKARAAATAKATEVAACKAEIAVLVERVDGAKTRLADAVPPETIPEKPETDPERLEALRGSLKAVVEDVAEGRAAVRKATRGDVDALAALNQAQAFRRRIDLDMCPTCEQPIPDAKRAAAVEAVEVAEAGAKTRAAEVAAEVKALEADLADLLEEHATIDEERARLEGAEAIAASVGRELEAIDKLAETQKAALADLATARTDLQAKRLDLENLDLDHRHLEAAARVLSTKGVRAHLLAKTIAAVEAAANAWLGRICDERLKLNLRPYGTKKDGSQKDSVALTLEVERDAAAKAMLESTGDDVVDAAERGYTNASGGERRRLDVALCFALAEVAEAARGETGSTVFADEIFDALDREGVSRVATALSTLAQDRCVVVIAHEAADQLRAVAREHWRVVDGTLQRV